MLSKLTTLYKFHAHRFGHIRFAEPVVVIESDDWGKVQGKPDGDYPSKYGSRTIWSYDQLENTEELESLFALLKSYENRVARPPVFTANFIVSNPDFEAVKKNNYKSLTLKTIDKEFPDLVPVWKKGQTENVFFPQYHGRLHYNPEVYLDALQQEDCMRHLFDQGINGGMENYLNDAFDYYSEYVNFQTEKPVENLAGWMTAGLSDFERIFGFKSQSTVAPNYVVHPDSFPQFAASGIKYMQASNKFFRKENGKEMAQNYCLGANLKGEMTAITRNHKFEPCRGKKEWQAPFSIQSAHGWFEMGVPFILDSHRINYVGKFAAHSRQQLKILLDELTAVKNIQFLTTTELGEAITQNGSYRCVFTGEKKQLTLKDTILRKQVRKWVK